MNRISLIVLLMALLASCGQGNIATPENAMTAFEAFKRKEKFLPDSTLSYPGISDAALRPALAEKINLAADDFQALAARGSATDTDYQKAIAKGLERFSVHTLDLNTEDRERVCSYFEELMDIVGLESSDGQLNTFMYGFDPAG